MKNIALIVVLVTATILTAADPLVEGYWAPHDHLCSPAELRARLEYYLKTDPDNVFDRAHENCDGPQDRDTY